MQTRRLFGLPLLEWLAFVAYCSVLVFVVPFHEPWADEAQAWLIGQSLPFHEIVHELGYEGTPPLWSSCCVPLIVCTCHILGCDGSPRRLLLLAFLCCFATVRCLVI